MVITAPTRITIEVTPLQPGEGGHAAVPAQVVVSQVEPSADAPQPAVYEALPCHCLDDEDCTADHEHE
jgi:hypothetical protein